MTTNLLTPEQVADRLAVTPKAVRQWLREGKLPGLRLGRLWRVRPADLDAFIAGDGFALAGPPRGPSKRTASKAPPRARKVKKAATRKRTGPGKAATRKRRGVASTKRGKRT